tara:strand:+ start:327 stop:476 length:150 start_codon:yes stop_codon:yes gene_type:complete
MAKKKTLKSMGITRGFASWHGAYTSVYYLKGVAWTSKDLAIKAATKRKN